MEATGVQEIERAGARCGAALLLVAFVSTMSAAARAQEGFPLQAAPPTAPASGAPLPERAAGPPPPAVSSAPAADPPGDPPKRAFPPAAEGFQAAFRSGFSFPVGDATSRPNDTLASRYAWQVPIAVDLGMRFAENFFVGGYLGIGFGSTGSDAQLERDCADDNEDFDDDIVCSAVTLRAGLEVQYSFRPDERLNPWVGYGFGFEAASAKLSDQRRGYEETVTSSGLTYAQLSTGFDMRHAVGFGPFLEASVGSFRRVTTDSGDTLTTSRPIQDPALHVWLMLGVRLVVNP